MIEQLESHEIDFMIDSSPVDTKYNNVIVEKLVTFPNSFIANKKYDENMNSLKDFEDEPFILPVNRSSRRKELESLLTTNNIELKNIIEIETTEMAISAAKKGFGICVIAEEAVKTELEQGQLYKLNVKEKLPGLEINIVYIENFLPPAPRKFIDMFLQKKDQK